MLKTSTRSIENWYWSTCEPTNRQTMSIHTHWMKKFKFLYCTTTNCSIIIDEILSPYIYAITCELSTVQFSFSSINLMYSSISNWLHKIWKYYNGKWWRRKNSDYDNISNNNHWDKAMKWKNDIFEMCVCVV